MKTPKDGNLRGTSLQAVAFNVKIVHGCELIQDQTSYNFFFYKFAFDFLAAINPCTALTMDRACGTHARSPPIRSRGEVRRQTRLLRIYIAASKCTRFSVRKIGCVEQALEVFIGVFLSQKTEWTSVTWIVYSAVVIQKIRRRE
jgi:hypothetical protein